MRAAKATGNVPLKFGRGNKLATDVLEGERARELRGGCARDVRDGCGVRADVLSLAAFPPSYVGCPALFSA